MTPDAGVVDGVCRELMRMIGEDGRFVMPGEFIAHAEHTGLINELDEYAIEQALRLADAGAVAFDRGDEFWVIFKRQPALIDRIDWRVDRD